MINIPQAPVLLYYTCFFSMYFIMCSLLLSGQRLTKEEDVCQLGKSPTPNHKKQNSLARTSAIH